MQHLNAFLQADSIGSNG